MPKRRFSRKGSFKTRRRRSFKGRYSRMRKTGRFAGRYYRRTFRGGKWYRRYRKAPTSKLIVGRKHVYPFSRMPDRKHFKLSVRGLGQQLWIGDVSYLGYTLQMSPIEWGTPEWPQSSAGNTGAWFADGINSTFTSTTGMSTSPGSAIIGTCYRYVWISGFKITWEVIREDHADDAMVEIGMVPLLQSQQTSPSFSGAPPYTKFNSIDSNDNTRWANFKLQPGAKFKKMSSTYGGHYKCRLSMYVSTKKYVEAGFPLAAPAFWLTTNSTYVNNWTYTAGSAAAASHQFPYMHFGMYGDGGAVGNYQLDHRISITWYLTAHEPITYYVVARNLGGAMGGGEAKTETKEDTKEDSKEEKKDDDDDFSPEDLKEFEALTMKRTKRMPVVKVPSTPPPTPPSSSSSSSSSLKSLIKK